MHEYGLCEGIVDAVQRRAGGRRVARIRVRVGVLHRIVDEAFRQAFSHVASGTEAENAALELVVIPARAVCRACWAEIEGADGIVVCPQCDGVDLELTVGDELILESLEYEAPAASRGAEE
jgi:hydrogenase nickel incorporation protein HypA/HybF